MRFLLDLLFLCFISTVAIAQPTPKTKYWIFFQDKGVSFDKKRSIDTLSVSLQALERRHTRGALTPRHVDTPLTIDYVSQTAQLGVHPIVKSRWLNAISAYLDHTQIDRIKQLPFVKAIQPVGRVIQPEQAKMLQREFPTPPSVLAPADSFNYGQAFAQLDQINAIPVLNRGINGTGVRIGFLDTFYNEFAHPVFVRMREEGRLIEIRNFTDPQTNSHGYRVASTVVGFADGELIGPAWGAEVLAATTEFAPSETNQEEDFFVEGLEWLEREGVDVVNVSLGYSTFDAGQHSYTTDDLNGDTGITTKAVDIAASLGVVVVTSAGNSGCDDPAFCWYYVTMPADADSAIAVGAVSLNNARASFSSLGPTADGRIKPDVMALGISTYHASGDSSYSIGNGTSFSSPLVAGVVAQMLQVNPELNPIQVRDLLRETASQSDAPDNRMGWGIVNAEAAVEAAEALATSQEHPIEDLPNQVLITGTFPNPASTRLHIGVSFGEFIASSKITVYNVLGQRVIESTMDASQTGMELIPLNVSLLAPGVYFAVLETNGQTAAATRFLVAR